MFKLDIDEIANKLKEESERSGGTLPELYRIAWQAYLHEDVIDYNDYIELRECGYFPAFEDDPEINNPVLAMSCGKHYKDNYYGIAEGDFVDESEFEGLVREITQDTRHFGGALTPPFIVAWSGKLLALLHCKEITLDEYQRLSSMLPVLEDNPVKKVEEFTRRYAALTNDP